MAIANAAAEPARPKYAELIYDCLIDAPNNTRSTKDIYAWVETHSSYADDISSHTWRSGISQNLQRNPAFVKVGSGLTAAADQVDRNLWTLSQDALENGIVIDARYGKSSKRVVKKDKAFEGTQAFGTKSVAPRAQGSIPTRPKEQDDLVERSQANPGPGANEEGYGVHRQKTLLAPRPPSQSYLASLHVLGQPSISAANIASNSLTLSKNRNSILLRSTERRGDLTRHGSESMIISGAQHSLVSRNLQHKPSVEVTLDSETSTERQATRTIRKAAEFLRKLNIDAEAQRDYAIEVRQSEKLLQEDQKIRGTAMLIHPNFVDWLLDPISRLVVVQGRDPEYASTMNSCLSCYLQLACERAVKDGDAACTYDCRIGASPDRVSSMANLVSDLVRSICWQLVYWHSHELEVSMVEDDDFELLKALEEGDVNESLKLLRIFLTRTTCMTTVLLVVDNAHLLESSENLPSFRTLVNVLFSTIVASRKAGNCPLKVLLAYPEFSQYDKYWESKDFLIDMLGYWVETAENLGQPSTADDLDRFWPSECSGDAERRKKLSWHGLQEAVNVDKPSHRRLATHALEIGRTVPSETHLQVQALLMDKVFRRWIYTRSSGILVIHEIENLGSRDSNPPESWHCSAMTSYGKLVCSWITAEKHATALESFSASPTESNYVKGTLTTTVLRLFCDQLLAFIPIRDGVLEMGIEAQDIQRIAQQHFDTLWSIFCKLIEIPRSGNDLVLFIDAAHLIAADNPKVFQTMLERLTTLVHDAFDSKGHFNVKILITCAGKWNSASAPLVDVLTIKSVDASKSSLPDGQKLLEATTESVHECLNQLA